MYRYLTEALGLEKEKDMSNIKEDSLKQLRNLREKHKLKIESKLETLYNNDELETHPDDFDLSITVVQNCVKCYEQHKLREFVQQGGCPNDNQGTE